MCVGRSAGITVELRCVWKYLHATLDMLGVSML